MTKILGPAGLCLGLALLATLPFASASQAGCGCDHPPPAWAPIMPAFASPGAKLLIHAEGGDFEIGGRYRVEFLMSSWWKPRVTVVADSASQLRAKVPPLLSPGPVVIRVSGPGYDHTYDESLFTAMGLPHRIPAGDSLTLIQDLRVAVTTDGTMLIPFDLSKIQDPTQFAFALSDMTLRFGASDVVFYNRDGVDLTLFTLDVKDPTQRQWGSYYGWDVENDA